MTPADLVALGLKVFPVTPNKRPAFKGWQEYAVRATLADLRTEWRKGTRAFGIYLAPSRIVVLDADTATAEAWSDEHLPPTPMMTITKRGAHRYYRLPDGAPTPKDNRPIAGLALDRKAKGYTVAPGSILGGFVYKAQTFWDTPLSEIPEYPAHLFPVEREVEHCSVIVPDLALSQDGLRIIKWFNENSEPSVQGLEGSRAMKRAASFFLNGLALSEDEAMACMQEWNKAKADPPWSDREMIHALETSSREGAINGRPRGWAYSDWAKA